MGTAVMAGLQITAECTPQSLGGDTVALACAGMIANATARPLYVVAIAATQNGGQEQILAYDLLPGMAPVSLPAPPVGGSWAIATQTPRQAREIRDWAIIGGLVVYSFAGIGLGVLAREAWAALRGRR